MFVNYREPELEQLLDAEQNEQWKTLAAELKMEGQLSTTIRKNEDEGAANPYMRINKRWLKIFKTICPDKSDYLNYSFSTIPLDGLAEIALCLQQKYFDKIEIWFDNVEKDPLIVGINNGKWSSDSKHYLVGRFGDEVLPLEQLEQKAISRLHSALQTKISKVQKTLIESVHEYLDDDRDIVISISAGHGSLYY